MSYNLKQYGVSAAAILRYLKRFDEIGGENHGMIVIKDGKKIFERYCYPYTADMPRTMFSVTKCLVSTAVGFAVDEKKLSLDDKILPYFKEYPHKKNKEWDNMTVRTLLLMRSNKKFSFLQDMTDDHTKIFMKNPFRRKKDFFYSNNDAHVLAHLVEIVTGERLVDYLTPRLFEPLGIKKPFWETNALGVCVGGSGLYLTCDDLAKIALCYLDGGKYDGRQIIPAFWAEAVATKQTTPSKNWAADGFSYYFWLEKNGSYRLEGLFGQFGVIIPEKKTVIAVIGAHVSDALIAKTINDYLVKDIFLDEDGEEELEEYLRERDKRLLPHVAERNIEKEVISSRKVYKRKGCAVEISKLMTRFSNGLIPNSISSSFAKRPKDSVDDLTFAFSDDRVRVTWREEKDVVSFDCGVDGKPLITDVTLQDNVYHVWSWGYWKKNDFHVVTRPLNTVAQKEFIFRFGKDKVSMKTKCNPDFRDFVVANSIASGVFPDLPVVTPILVGLLKTGLIVTTFPVRFVKK